MLTNESPPADVAAAIVAETNRRGYGRDESIACVSTGIQESGLRMVWDSGKRWFGYFQQDGSYPNRFDPMGNILGFLDRLDVKRRSPGASPDPFKNIFWLQQRPSEDSADEAFNDPRARRAYYDEIKRHIAAATAYYDRNSGGGQPVGWTGDPVWLEEVLRPALGDRLRTLPGWRRRGHGDFRDIRGVMMHHTGSANASAESIRDGRPDLAGPLSQIHIAQNGIVTIVAVGVAWHAGAGAYPWLPTNNANWHMIGIECAWPKDPNNKGERWPDAQVISMRDTAAALIRKLGFGADRVIGHKEYAGASQGKWDPGNMDMGWFRGEVDKDLRGVFDKPSPPPPPPVVQPPPVLGIGPLPFKTEREIAEETLRQLRGPYLKGWDQLGGKTIVDSLADLHRKFDNFQVERLAQMGDSESLAAVKKLADEGDERAQIVYRYCTEGG